MHETTRARAGAIRADKAEGWRGMERRTPKLIIGLGNPGAAYAHTRHNVGFMVVDRALGKATRVLSETHRFESVLYQYRYRGWTAFAAKPQTFMNRSGQAAAGLVRGLDVSPQDVFVIYDCLDLPLGRIRVRMRGGSGGHRGMESVVAALGTDEIPRLRVGIGREPYRDTVSYVLQNWPAESKPLLTDVVEAAADTVLMAGRYGLQKAMDTYNAWQPQHEADELQQGE